MKNGAAAAAELDELEQERMVWKRTKPCADYQYKRIAKNVESRRNLIASHQQQQQLQQQAARLRPRTPVDVTNNPYTMPASTATTTSTSPNNIPNNTTLLAPTTSSTTAAAGVDTTSASSAASSSPSPASATAASSSSSSSVTFASPRSMPSATPTTRSSDPLALMSFLRSRLSRHIGNSTTNTRLYFDSSTDHFVSSFPDRDMLVQSERGPPLASSWYKAAH